MILRHAYLENREFEACAAEPDGRSPMLRGLISVLYNLYCLFNPLQARLPCRLLPTTDPDRAQHLAGLAGQEEFVHMSSCEFGVPDLSAVSPCAFGLHKHICALQ